MEESNPRQLDEQLYLTQGFKFRTNLPDKIPFKISCQRPVSPLQRKDRTPSPHTRNYKDKHLMYKKDLLQEKFQNLQVNPKQEKKPLKLKLQRVNNQNNILLKQMADISNEIEIKFQAQNCLIKKSLQKLEKMVSKNIPNKVLQRVQSSKRLNQKQKRLEIGPTQKEKNLQSQLQKVVQQKGKLQDEIRGMKSVNNFLSNQNYKLSLQISMLKQKIMEYEQTDYDNALKTVKNMSSYNEDSISSDQEQNGSDKLSKVHLSSEIQEESQILSNAPIQNTVNQDLLLKQIQTQNSKKQSKFNQKKLQFNLQTTKPNFSTQEVQSQRTKQQNQNSVAEQFLRLSNRIMQLEEQLEEQKLINDSLSNKIASLKLQLYDCAQVKIEPQIEERMDSAISINMDIKQNRLEQQQIQLEQKADQIKETDRNLELQPITFSHKGTKSKILSNQIIYFAETISAQKSNSHLKSSNGLEMNQKKIFKPSKQVIQLAPPQQIQGPQLDDNSDQKKKTLCLKKLQVPSLQVQKRRKSISDKLNSSLMKKGLSLGNNLSFYSNQKVAQLEIIRETISLKFEAFKYTFELFQNQMILWPNSKLNIKQLKSVLSEYPFFLDEFSIEMIIQYCNVAQGKDIKVDVFCNKLKQFIEEYQEMTEQEELILQKKIYKRWKYTKDQILQIMKKNQCEPGEIEKAKFVCVLQEFKFEEKEIHHLLAQSVAISSDINHIKYRQYLQNFLTKK